VHSDDVGEAYRLAALGDARGAFSIAAEPVLDTAGVARLLGARTVPIAPTVLRAGAAAAFALRLTPTEPGWLDMALGPQTSGPLRLREILTAVGARQ
jgi:hypothetical protein